MGELYASPPQPLAFGRSLERRAFLLRHDKGNLLVVSSRAAAERHIDAIIERLRRGENH